MQSARGAGRESEVEMETRSGRSPFSTTRALESPSGRSLVPSREARQSPVQAHAIPSIEAPLASVTRRAMQVRVMGAECRLRSIRGEGRHTASSSL
jgi:hypothetical protein